MRKRHILRKIRIRQTWNKYNLYNLSRLQPQRTQERTFFQQKWEAKAATRAYHGEAVREKKWTRMFRRTIRAVVPADHTYLAKNDGSEQAEGRGSGVEEAPNDRRRALPRTPHMQMVYAPLERRLDTAIFRSLFASSSRQARQMVVHGDVKVNGKKMIYPGYQLNPGDMFQVDPERVLFATGATKSTAELRATRKWKRKAEQKKEEEAEEGDSPGNEEQTAPATSAAKPTPQPTLKSLFTRAKSLLSTPSASLTAKRKQDLRAFQKMAKRALSRRDDLATTSLDTQLQEIVSRMTPKEETPSIDNNATEIAPKMSDSSLQAEASSLNPEQMKILREALAEARDNPLDISKPYATPWRPRPYMSAFAFVPRYLEVHPKICAAVYIRHPVARPGLGEVPTPFTFETNALAHNWYLRRR